MSPKSVPVVDLRDLSPEASPEARAAAARDLRTAFGHFGLVYVKNHGVDAANVSSLYDDFLAFSRRPDADKATLGGEKLWYQRGWTPPNTEKAVVAGGQPDFKECYFAAPLDLDASQKASYPQVFADNVWPEGRAGEGFDAPGFRERYLAMGRALHQAGLALLRGAALALGVPEATFEAMCTGAPHVTRVLHYLPLNDAQLGKGILWGEEHTDFNLLTLLPGGRFYDAEKKPCARPDDKSGLFLRTRATDEHPRGTLVRGVAPEGCIVAQVGQQLEILSNGAFLATPHVITAPGKPGFSRASSAHFVHVHPSTVLYPLETLRTAASAEEYGPPVLAGTYGIKTLVDIGLAPPSALDRLGYRHYGRLGAIRAEEADALS